MRPALNWTNPLPNLFACSLLSEHSSQQCWDGPALSVGAAVSMSIERRTISALKWVASGRLLSQLATWTITLVVLRLLSPSDYGLMALVSVVIAISLSVAEGLAASLIQARELEPELLARIAGFVFLLHLLLTLALLVAAPLLADFFGDPRLTPLMRVAALHFVFSAIGAVPQALATRALEFKWLAKVELGTAIASSLSVLLMALLGLGVWALVLGAVASTALRSLLLARRGTNVWPDFRLRGLPRHLDFGFKFALGAVVWTIAVQLDVMVGGRFLSSDELGVYAVGLYVAAMPMNKVMGVINQVAFSAVARLQDEGARLRMRLVQATGLMSATSVPLLWGLSAVAPEFVVVLLGVKWESAIVPLQLISLVVPLRMASALLATALAGEGYAGIALRNTLIVAGVWGACFLVGVQWGANGLAVSWLLAVPLSFGLNLPVACRALGLRMASLTRQLMVPMCAGGVMYGAVFVARIWTQDLPDVYRLPLLVSVGVMSYLPILRLLDRDNWNEMRRLVRAMGVNAST